MENETEKRIKLPLYISKAILIFALVFFLGAGVFAFVYFWGQKIPSKAEIENLSFKQTSKIYDESGRHILYEVHGDENRTILNHDDIPDVMRVAIIAAEDDDFYSHHGIDIPSIFRAFKENITNNRISQGASTITQQLVRNIFLTREKTYDRKIKEVFLALKMERVFSKDEILDLYLNGVSFGSNTYGIQSAAQMFFGKDAKNLTLDEAALLAALPKATTYYSPYNNHRDDLVARQKEILKKIKKEKKLDDRIVDEAIQADTLSKVITPNDSIEAPHFVFYFLEQLESQLGEKAVEEGGLEIKTTLDFDLQKKAEALVKEYADTELKKFGASNAAAVILDTRTGEIKAMVGSRDFFDKNIDGEVNVATSMRQPGSAIKPIVYASAFKKGYQPETMIYDVETNFGPDGSGKDYIPQNYNLTYAGLVNMRSALAMSLNIPAVKTLYLSGIDNFLATAESLGINSLKKVKSPGLALSLGGGDLTLLELTNAFRIFGNDGIGGIPKSVADITGPNDFLELESLKKVSTDRAIDSEVARKINSILSDSSARAPVFGFSSNLGIKGKTIAVKTGTTQDYRDAWTVGYTPSLAVGVWVGNNDYSPMREGSAGIYAAAPLWNELMGLVLENKPDETWQNYQKVESDNLMVTGRLDQEIEYFNEKTGKKLSEKDLEKTKKSKIRERAVAAKHSILYYVDKDHPLEKKENFSSNDPMLFRWEDAIINPKEEESK